MWRTLTAWRPPRPVAGDQLTVSTAKAPQARDAWGQLARSCAHVRVTVAHTWFRSSMIARQAASFTNAGAGQLGNPNPRLTAPVSRASGENSCHMVGAPLLLPRRCAGQYVSALPDAGSVRDVGED